MAQTVIERSLCIFVKVYVHSLLPKLPTQKEILGTFTTEAAHTMALHAVSSQYSRRLCRSWCLQPAAMSKSPR